MTAIVEMEPSVYIHNGERRGVRKMATFTDTTMSYRYAGHIVAALARQDGRLLLVEQQGPDDAEPGWALPAGKVEPGEGLVAALRRELREETGLVLEGAPRVVFTVQVLQEGDRAVEEVGVFTFTCDVSGEIQPDDPDGLVLSAQWVEESDALDRLALLGWYDRVPLQRWLSGEADGGMVSLPLQFLGGIEA